MTYELNYFPLWAKGPAPALALHHSGLEWKGTFLTDPPPDDLIGCWFGKDGKPGIKNGFPFGELPAMEIPGMGWMGQELTILNYIGRKVPAMAGADDKEFVNSGQVMQIAEDMYQKLVKIQPTVLDPKDGENGPVKDGTVAKFWATADGAVHNLDQGAGVYLSHLEKFHGQCGAGAGKYTSTGTTAGECKLFASLHAYKLIKGDCLDAFPGVKGFYDAFAAHPKTKEILESGGKFPGPMAQYFVLPKAE